MKVSNVTRHKDNVRTELHGKRSLLLSLVVLALLHERTKLFKWFRFSNVCSFGEKECWSMIS